MTIWSLGVSVALAIGFAAGSGIVPRIFTGDAGVLDAVGTPWWFFVAMLPIAGGVVALDGVLLGSADAAFLRTACPRWPSTVDLACTPV